MSSHFIVSAGDARIQVGAEKSQNLSLWINKARRQREIEDSEYFGKRGAVREIWDLCINALF